MWFHKSCDETTLFVYQLWCLKYHRVLQPNMKAIQEALQDALGLPDPPKRIDVATLKAYGGPVDLAAEIYVCGPTSFVEATADIMISLGNDPRQIRTERFGGK